MIRTAEKAVLVAFVVALASFATAASVPRRRDAERHTTIPIGATWLNRAWGVSRNPVANADNGQQVVTVSLYNGLTRDQIADYQEKNKFVICYTSAGHIFQSELSKYPEVPLLNRVKDEYRGERWWVDITNYEKADRWVEDKLKMAKDLGCDAVELDNSDCWEYKDCHSKYPRIQDPTLKQAQLKMLHYLVSKVHDMGLQVGLKNEATLVAIDQTLSDKYDFSIVENCNHYCSPFDAFIQKGKAVLSVQNVKYRYKNEQRSGRESLKSLACRDARKRKFTRLTDFEGSGWEPCE